MLTVNTWHIRGLLKTPDFIKCDSLKYATYLNTCTLNTVKFDRWQQRGLIFTLFHAFLTFVTPGGVRCGVQGGTEVRRRREGQQGGQQGGQKGSEVILGWPVASSSSSWGQSLFTFWKACGLPIGQPLFGFISPSYGLILLLLLKQNENNKSLRWFLYDLASIFCMFSDSGNRVFSRTAPLFELILQWLTVKMN